MDSFTWNDGERRIRFGRGAAAEAAGLAAGHGLSGFVLLASERTAALLPALARAAADVMLVPQGPVADAAAGLLEAVGARPIVAAGGGRVIDTAKAVAAVTGQRCGAVPTTLSGAELTPVHRLPRGHEGVRRVRPALVVADPDLAASQRLPALAASAANALAHAAEALYAPDRNPVADLAALRGAALLAAGLRPHEPDRDALALGALLAGYALGATRYALHHVLCQSIVAVCGTPHAPTNAVVLPHVLEAMTPRAPASLSRLAEALGGPPQPEAAALAARAITRRAGVDRLGALGVTENQLPGVVDATIERPELAATPSPPGPEELLALLRRAL